MSSVDITPKAVEHLADRLTAPIIVGFNPGGETITRAAGGIHADAAATLRAQAEKINELGLELARQINLRNHQCKLKLIAMDRAEELENRVLALLVDDEQTPPSAAQAVAS